MGNIITELSTLICSDITFLWKYTVNSEDEAMEYISNHDCSQYDHCCAKNEYPSIEIEAHQDDGSVAEVITID